jgi:ATP-dependent DNA helicase RecQ
VPRDLLVVGQATIHVVGQATNNDEKELDCRCRMNSQIKNILSQYWGYNQFRPLQEEIILSVLNGKDTLALLPTGGGKSVCYQVPAMAMEGMCIVVSPLIALMKDQADQLNKKSIPSLMLFSGLKRHQTEHLLKQAGTGKYKFLFVSPERLETNLFLEYLPAMNVNLLAVDEAHCISQWGYDFRPPYLRIATLREQLPGVPVLALTASATPDVQQDICEKLKFSTPLIFKSAFNRPELEYYVIKSEAKINTTLAILKKTSGSAIVYCGSRRKTREVSQLLNQQGISAGYYHAGLEYEERSKRQQQWIENEMRVMVCTNAFGMGIDKPDVRTVVHYDAPDAPEHYYQEAGRAGRDRQTSRAVLLYQPPDLDALRESVNIKFPAEEEIREVYLSIANFLQLPAGTGVGSYFEFDLDEFTKKFHHPVLLTVNVLRILAQEEYVSYNESVMLPSTVMVTANREALNEIETKFPELDPLLKTMLRTYAGILDQPVFVFEKKLAWTLHTEPVKMQEQLQRMVQLGILVYNPVKEKPQLFFLQNRVSGEQFTINRAFYELRKKRYEERLEAMIGYIENETGECRSRMLCAYFGDGQMADCGVCDACRKKKIPKTTFALFDELYKQVFEYLKKGNGVLMQQVKERFGEMAEEKIADVVRLMVSEEKVRVDKEGFIRCV